jgi:TrpR-related protein YerC/YecD
MRGEVMAYTSRLKDKMTDQLFEAVLLLENEEECYRFFEDICTVAEIKAIAQRLEVARMLDEDKIYTDIAEKTGASTATISRVKRCLHFGADGYRLILEKLKKK